MHFCCLYDAIAFSFQAQVVYAEIFPMEPRSRPLFFKWLVNVVYAKKKKKRQSNSVMWKFALIYYFYYYSFFFLCLPRERLHWVL